MTTALRLAPAAADARKLPEDGVCLGAGRRAWLAASIGYVFAIFFGVFLASGFDLGFSAR